MNSTNCFFSNLVWHLSDYTLYRL